MKTHHDRVAAISGASSGIGRALALQLAKAGCHLSLCDINEGGLAETARQAKTHGVHVSTHRVDVSSRDQVQKWAADTLRIHDAVHLVINNAGVSQSGTVTATDLADYEWVLNINLWGVIHGTKAFLPHLLAAGDGHIVNISSVFGLLAEPGVSAYNTSKFAVRGFTESLRQELDLLDAGVSATCVHPGGIDTDIVRSGRISDSTTDLFGDANAAILSLFDRMLVTSPDHAAKTILTGVQHDRRRVLIGLDARLLDLEQRLMPTGYQRVNRTVIGLVSTATRWLPRNATPAPPQPATPQPAPTTGPAPRTKRARTATSV